MTTSFLQQNEFARIVHDATILLAQIDATELDDPISYENYRHIKEN
jgi:uncharacterized protein (DUF952 family)